MQFKIGVGMGEVGMEEPFGPPIEGGARIGDLMRQLTWQGECHEFLWQSLVGLPTTPIPYFLNINTFKSFTQSRIYACIVVLQGRERSKSIPLPRMSASISRY